MLFISLGNACQVKYQIAEYNKKKYGSPGETHIFDWLMTSPDAIVQFISRPLDTDTMIARDKLIFHEKPHSGKAVISLSGFQQWESMHDLPYTYTEEQLNEFISKYRRRHRRLISLIQGEDPLCFIRVGDFTDENLQELCLAIERINPACRYIVAHLCNINIDSAKYIKINMNKHVLKGIVPTWRNEHYSWGRMFDKVASKLEARYKGVRLCQDEPL